MRGRLDKAIEIISSRQDLQTIPDGRDVSVSRVLESPARKGCRRFRQKPG